MIEPQAAVVAEILSGEVRADDLETWLLVIRAAEKAQRHVDTREIMLTYEKAISAAVYEVIRAMWFHKWLQPVVVQAWMGRDCKLESLGDYVERGIRLYRQPDKNVMMDVAKLNALVNKTDKLWQELHPNAKGGAMGTPEEWYEACKREFGV